MSLSFLSPLFEAVAWVIVQIHAGLSLIFPADSGWAWGLSIFLLTVLMRIIIFPLFVKQIHASRKMQELQPQVQALRKKYKKDKQRLNQEMMKLYQEAGANPLSGCLPLVVQFPIFISLYNVLRAISTAKPGESKYGVSAKLIYSAQHAHIFGAHIPSTFKDAFSSGHVGAMIVTGAAVVISSTTTFFTMKSSVGRSMQSMTADNPMMQSQKYLVYLSPLFGLFGLTLPLGVLIYWVTTNSWTLAQSHYVYKKYPMPKPGAEGNGAAAAKPAAGTKTGTAKTTTAKAGTAKTTRTAVKNGAAKPATGNALVGKAKKKEPEAEEPVEPVDDTPKAVRHQPSRQSRSKRKR
ncbi:membrane protein insertase YidC [Actinoallomurus soli]|uniref:membrane protein insertase YidC n=1 Tax=Actinoallomurus soli TaxID=2952535 RepID=UPI0020939D2C|nr:membrane protein insertase YidC [Actinoallomurus soli]MCO5970201.1 membrane protein insertase YidC [Actinoallomurus soli]